MQIKIKQHASDRVEENKYSPKAIGFGRSLPESDQKEKSSKSCKSCPKIKNIIESIHYKIKCLSRWEILRYSF